MVLKDIRARENFGLDVFLNNDGNGNTISWFSGLVLLVKCSTTVDPFVLIQSYKCGLLLGSLIGISIGVLSVLSFMIYVKCWAPNNSTTYTGLWRKIIGSNGDWIPSFLIIISFFTLTSWCTSEFHPDIVGIQKSTFSFQESSLPSKSFIDKILVLLSSIPALVTYRFSNMLSMAYIGTFGLILGCLCVVYEFIIKVKNEGIDPNSQLVWWNWDIEYVVSSYSYFNVAFYTHPILYLVVREMHFLTENCAKKMFSMSVLVTSIMDIPISILSYLMFYNNFEQDVKIIAYFPNKSITALVSKIGAFLSNFVNTCFYILFISIELCEFLHTQSSKSKICRMTAVFIAAWSGFAFTQLGDFAQELVYFIGSLAYYLLVFVLPPVYYLKTFGYSSKKWGIIALVIIFLTTPPAMIEFSFVIKDLLSE